MTDENLPVSRADDGSSFPAPAPALGRQGLAHPRDHRSLGLDLFEDRQEEDSDQIDLLKYWRVLVKRRWLVLSVLVATAALALLSTLMTTPMYRATAVMQMEQQSPQIIAGQSGQINSDAYSGDFRETQIELLKSRSLAERVAGKLNVGRVSLDQFDEPSWISRVIGLLRPKSSRREPVKDSVQASDPAQVASTLRAFAGVVQGGLSVAPVGTSQLVSISFDSPSPEFSSLVANTVGDEFIASYMERRFGATSYAKDYLEGQLQTTKAKLEESERKLIEYAHKEGLVITDEKGQTLAAQNLVQLNGSLMAAKEQRIRAQARLNSGVVPTEMLTASAVSNLRQQRATLMGQYQQKLAVFKPDYPEMQQLKQQIDEVNRQIDAEMGRVGSTVKAEYAAAAAQENALASQITALRSEAFTAEGSNIEYSILKRDVDTNRQLYDGLLQRFKEIGAGSDVRSNNISMIDRALPGYRFKPNLFQNLTQGLLLGALLGMLLAFLLEFLDDTIKTPEDIEQKLRLAVLGVIPKPGLKQRVDEAANNPQSPFSEAYRSVRAALQFATDHGIPKTLLVTSASPGDGKSTTALVLARNFAQLGKRVLLVEADLRNPSLARTLGLTDRTIGLSNLLAGGCNLSEATFDTDDPLLRVILAGPLPPNPAELLSGSKLVSMLTVAVEHYDQIVIDGPPVLGLADTPILSNAADGTLFVVAAANTKISAAQLAVKRVLAARGRLVGAILSKYDSKAAGYGYGYGYQYSAYDAQETRPKLTKG